MWWFYKKNKMSYRREMRWSREERDRGVSFLLFRQEIQNNRGAAKGARNEKKVLFPPFTCFFLKGTDCSPSKNPDGREQCKRCDLSLVLHLSRSWEEAEAPRFHLSYNLPKGESPMRRTLQHLLQSEEAQWMWIEKGIRRRHHRTPLKAQESYSPEYHMNLGESPPTPQQSCWTVELVSVRHLLVGIHIAQFLASELYLLSLFRI